MPAPNPVVLGTDHNRAEDELRLPRPPGVIRRFWGRHPFLTDILIAVGALLASLPALTARAPLQEPVSGWSVAAGVAMTAAAGVALVWRRRWPATVFAVSLLPVVMVEPALAAVLNGPVSLIALYSVAVYRGVRACWIAFGVAGTLIMILGLVRILSEPAQLGSQVSLDVSAIVFLLLGALVGINVGNRRRYLDALIDRSRQLLVERDQQAQLAAAAERTRIAREMHDIVSHSLTVIVALAEGAGATADRERAAEAARAIAGSARGALSEMRVMLGVLRDENADAPLAPLGDASVRDLVDGARTAGAPVTLSVTGAPEVAPAVRFAILRVVQEGLTNALRYARHPSYLRVAIAYADGGAVVSVENDGAVAGASSQGAGRGLQGLQERVSHVRGTMTAGMVAAGVWRIAAELPGARGDDG